MSRASSTGRHPLDDDDSGKLPVPSGLGLGTRRSRPTRDRAAIAADEAVRTGRNRLDQTVWWTDKEGITRAIDDLSDDHRRFIARMLVDRAAAMYARKRSSEIRSSYWAFVAWADDHDMCVSDHEPDRETILSDVRREEDDGQHLDWLRSTPLFRRMVRDLDWTHPGVADDGTRSR